MLKTQLQRSVRSRYTTSGAKVLKRTQTSTEMDNILRLSAAFNNSLTNAFRPRKQINRSAQQQEVHQPDAESTRDGETQGLENQNRPSGDTLQTNNMPVHENQQPVRTTDAEP